MKVCVKRPWFIGCTDILDILIIASAFIHVVSISIIPVTKNTVYTGATLAWAIISLLGCFFISLIAIPICTWIHFKHLSLRQKTWRRLITSWLCYVALFLMAEGYVFYALEKAIPWRSGIFVSGIFIACYFIAKPTFSKKSPS